MLVIHVAVGALIVRTAARDLQKRRICLLGRTKELCIVMHAHSKLFSHSGHQETLRLVVDYSESIKSICSVIISHDSSKLNSRR